MVGVFVACHLPYHVVELMSLWTYERYAAAAAGAAAGAGEGWRPSDAYKTAFIYINTAAQLLVFISSCCNPIIYGIFNKNYRE